MIQDLEGATTEPTRRHHVAALSAAVAAISFALLLALIVPPSREAAVPQAASHAPSTSPSLTLIASNPRDNVYVDLTRVIMCPDRTWPSAPPYLVAIEASSWGVFALPSEPRTSHSVPVAIVVDPRTGRQTLSSVPSTSRSAPVTYIYDRQGRYIVACATSDTVAPQEGLVRD